MSITFARVEAANLVQLEGDLGGIDPYVRWTARGQITETHFLRNVLSRAGRNPSDSSNVLQWDGEYTMDLQFDDGGVEVSMSVWDARVGGADRFLAGATFIVRPHTAHDSRMTLDLEDRFGEPSVGAGGRSSVSFTASLEPHLRAPVADEPATAIAPPPLTRREIRTMPEADQRRFVAALQRMMVEDEGEGGAEGGVEGGAEGSAFFKLAAIHGWPGKGTERNYSYCEHRQETFPAWHRAYLCAFEEALQHADRSLGNDGRISLPYWDVLERPLIDGQVVPKALRDHFPNGTEMVRRLLANPATRTDPRTPKQNEQREVLWRRGYAIADDDVIRRAVERERLGQRAREMLWVAQHYRAASTFGSSSTDSIETPHDLVHILCGYPMRSLMHAAFHPCFWLHHCNIDRLYSAYLEHHPDSRAEFESNQESGRIVNTRKGRADRFDAWLEPFYLPGKPESPEARFFPRHTFHTRELGYVYDSLPARPNQALTAPPVLAVFESIDVNLLPTGYTLFVFCFPRGPRGGAHPTPPLGPTVNRMLDHPNLGGIGALFTGRADTCTTCQSAEPFDVRVDVSGTLRSLRLKPSEVELRVVVETAEDEWLHLADTPIPQPSLRGGGTHVTPMHDLESEQYAPGNDTPTFPAGSTISYVVEASPGYLPRSKVLHEISQMFTQWSGPLASGLTFTRLPLWRAAEAQLVVGWDDHSGSNPFRFDGPGGKLAEASRREIMLDSSERWMVHGAGWEAYNRCLAEPGAGRAFFLGPVILHEIGHAIGLTHSSHEGDVMHPYYTPDRVNLSERDLSRARAAYGVTNLEHGVRTPLEYLQEHKERVEEAVGRAINDAIAKRAIRPIKHVAEYLLQADREQQQVAPGGGATVALSEIT
jgi:hypothetical protein